MGLFSNLTLTHPGTKTSSCPPALPDVLDTLNLYLLNSVLCDCLSQCVNEKGTVHVLGHHFKVIGEKSLFHHRSIRDYPTNVRVIPTDSERKVRLKTGGQLVTHQSTHGEYDSDGFYST